MIEQITNAALAPFLEQVGWQGFAYGLLGLKTLKRAYSTVKEMASGENGGDSDEK
jgi:hypothetical protein